MASCFSRQAPISSLMLAAVIQFLEPPFAETGVMGKALPLAAWVRLYRFRSAHYQQAAFVSAIVAFVVNLSIFMVIGKTSPITYNVLGHFKLCTVLAGGFLIFHDPLNANQVCCHHI
jgi:solute carrier family 35 protein E3